MSTLMESIFLSTFIKLLKLFDVENMKTVSSIQAIVSYNFINKNKVQHLCDLKIKEFILMSFDSLDARRPLRKIISYGINRCMYSFIFKMSINAPIPKEYNLIMQKKIRNILSKCPS